MVEFKAVSDAQQLSFGSAISPEKRKYVLRKLESLHNFLEDEVDSKILRLSLDFLIGKSLFPHINGARFGNFGAMSNKLLLEMPRSEKAHEIIICDKRDRREKSKLLVTEHMVPMSELREIFRAREYEKLLNKFALCFITRIEHERMGRDTLPGRYATANINILVSNDLMILKSRNGEE